MQFRKKEATCHSEDRI